EFFLALEPGTVAVPHLLERAVAALRANPEVCAVTCFGVVVRGRDEPVQFGGALRPVGGPLALACLENVYGEGAAFRTAALRSSGGPEGGPADPFGDWELLVKLAVDGHQVDVVPDYLYCRREREPAAGDPDQGSARVTRLLAGMDSLPLTERVG